MGHFLANIGISVPINERNKSINGDDVLGFMCAEVDDGANVRINERRRMNESAIIPIKAKIAWN